MRLVLKITRIVLMAVVVSVLAAFGYVWVTGEGNQYLALSGSVVLLCSLAITRIDAGLKRWNRQERREADE
jgi:hypothetical protein